MRKIGECHVASLMQNWKIRKFKKMKKCKTLSTHHFFIFASEKTRLRSYALCNSGFHDRGAFQEAMGFKHLQQNSSPQPPNTPTTVKNMYPISNDSFAQKVLVLVMSGFSSWYRIILLFLSFNVWFKIWVIAGSKLGSWCKIYFHYFMIFLSNS
jgi:hypothetical protein